MQKSAFAIFKMIAYDCAWWWVPYLPTLQSQKITLCYSSCYFKLPDINYFDTQAFYMENYRIFSILMKSTYDLLYGPRAISPSTLPLASGQMDGNFLCFIYLPFCSLHWGQITGDCGFAFFIKVRQRLPLYPLSLHKIKDCRCGVLPWKSS